MPFRARRADLVPARARRRGSVGPAAAAAVAAEPRGAGRLSSPRGAGRQLSHRRPLVRRTVWGGRAGRRRPEGEAPAVSARPHPRSSSLAVQRRPRSTAARRCRRAAAASAHPLSLRRHPGTGLLAEPEAEHPGAHTAIGIASSIYDFLNLGTCTYVYTSVPGHVA
eukprot:SAG31_NODE_64_length_28590_cov_17.914464_27_plen_166_part_00